MGAEITAQEGPQTTFLQSSADVVIYGGAAGGGKTYALLLEPLYDIDKPEFRAVIFRRTLKQAKKPGSVWDTAGDVYPLLKARSNENDLEYTFPSGASVEIGHMEHEKNRHDWQGSQIPLIQFDELTHFTWRQFSYMLSRNRSVGGARKRIRGTCNPDPDSWVRRFIDWYIGSDGFAIPERSGVVRYFTVYQGEVVWGDTAAEVIGKLPASLRPRAQVKSFTFIHSDVYDNRKLLEDNPEYLANLQALDSVERARLLDGNWDIRATAGTYFQRGMFQIVDAGPPAKKRKVRAWDQAGTRQKEGADPDATASVLMYEGADGYYYIEHAERSWQEPREVDARIRNVASQDGKRVIVRLAQDPGQAGKSQAAYQTKMLAGYTVRARPITGDKETRARPLASQAQAGNVRLVRGAWNEQFLSELEAFPDGGHDDFVDAAADAFDELTNSRTKTAGVW